MKLKLNKQQKRSLLIPWRRITATFRCLPDFIIIGAPKCGTSSLYYYLTQHPQIKPCIKKEINFFNGGKNPTVDLYAKGLNWYRTHFPLNLNKKRSFITGEGSTLYLFNPLVPKRIHKHLPNIKLIVMLRNPITRAHSQYYHELRKGREPLPMLEALQAEEKRTANALLRQDYKNNDLINYSYLKKGLYAEQLERYFHFFDKNQIMIIKSEEFFENTSQILKQIWKFLNVDQDVTVPDLTPRQSGKNKQTMDPKVRKYLESYYKKPNQRLYEMLGRYFDWQ